MINMHCPRPPRYIADTALKNNPGVQSYVNSIPVALQIHAQIPKDMSWVHWAPVGGVVFFGIRSIYLPVSQTVPAWHDGAHFGLQQQHERTNSTPSEKTTRRVQLNVLANSVRSCLFLSNHKDYTCTVGDPLLVGSTFKHTKDCLTVFFPNQAGWRL